MAKLTSADYENVLDLIEAVYRAPNVSGVSRLGCATACGHTVANIITSLRQHFPTNTMTDTEVEDLLARGARQGVFNKACATATDSEVSECEPLGTSQPLYHVNNNMVRVNQANKVYADAFNTALEEPAFVEVSNDDMGAAIACAGSFNSGDANII
jgi:hypothetical protein